MKKEEKLDSITYTYTVEPDMMMHCLEHAYEHVKQDIEIKGFRKGQVPFKKYLQINERGLYQDALDHIFGHMFSEISEDTKDDLPSKFAGQPVPEVNPESISSVVPFDVSITLPLAPVIYGDTYKGYKFTLSKVEVSDDAVQKSIERNLSKDAPLRLKENQVIELGDTVIFDFSGSVNGIKFDGGEAENYELVIGSNSFIPGFEEQMLGLHAGDKKAITVNFPQEYAQVDLAGKEAVFDLVIHEVKTQGLETISDELILSLDKEAKTVEEVFASQKKLLLEDLEKQNDNKLSEELNNQLLENFEIVCHDSLITDEENRFREDAEEQAKKYKIDFGMFLQLSGFTEESFNKFIKDRAEKTVKIGAILNKIASLESLEASEEEIATEFEELNKYYTPDIIKEHYNDIKANVTQNILREKALKFVKDNSIITYE